MSRAQGPSSYSVPLAFAAAGACLAAVEVLGLGVDRDAGVPWAGLAPAVLRLASFGLLVGLVVWVIEALLHRAGPRSSLRSRLLLLVAIAAGGAWLTWRGGAARDGGAAAAGAFGVLAAGGASLVALAFYAWWRNWLALLLAGGALGLALVDPRGLRGTYPSFDLLLLGTALGLLAVSLMVLCERVAVRRALLALLVVAFAVVTWRSDAAGRATLLAASPRFQALDRWWTGHGFFIPDDDDSGGVAIDPEELFRPPADAAAARADWAKRRVGKRPLSVLWVTIDALRPEVTGLRSGTCTPHLDALAKEGFAFARAFSQAPGTGVSVESMFTSRYPGRTSVSRAWASGGDIERFDSLAAILEEAGWRSFFISGMSADTLSRPQFRLMGSGFGLVEGSKVPTDAMETANRTIARLPVGDDQPFFCWVHLFDPHEPYVARDEAGSSKEPRTRWESEVRYADRGLRHLLDALDERGLDDETVVVVHADHAEAFGEHGRFYHASSYFDTQIHVPLVLRVPGLPAATIERPVGNVDVAPTLLELLGLEVPRFMQGSSLLPLLLQPDLEWPRATFAETLIIEDGLGWTRDRIRVVTDGRWKLIEHLSDRTTMLFDRDADPLEQENRAGSEPEVVARLRGWLRAQDEWCARSDEDAGQLATPRTPWETWRPRLLAEDPFARRDALQELVAARRPDLATMLQARLGELPSDTAHQAAMLLDSVLHPWMTAEVPEVALPRRAGGLRYRLLERYARNPGLVRHEIPEVVAPRSALEELAWLEARGARGEAEALRELRSREAASRLEWDHLAPILAMGGDASGAGLIAGDLVKLIFDEGRMLRGLRALAVADSPRFTEVIVTHWPSTKPRIEPLRFAELVALAAGLEHEGVHEALIAIHAEAAPRGRRALLATLKGIDARFDDEIVSALVKAWAEARSTTDEVRRKELLTRARALYPSGLSASWLDAEIARSGAEIDLDQIAHLEIVVEGVAAAPALRVEGPPRLRFLTRGQKAIALGGMWALAGLQLVWRGPGGETPAGEVWFPRRVLRPGAPLVARLALDYPRAPGRYRLSLPLGGRELIPDEHAVFYEVPAVRSWSGPAVARAIQTWGRPLRLVEDGGGFDVVTGGKAVTRLPALECVAGSVKVTLELTVHFEGEVTYSPRLRRDLKDPRAFPALRSGERMTVGQEIDIPKNGTYVLDCVWPDVPALVVIHRVEVSK